MRIYFGDAYRALEEMLHQFVERTPHLILAFLVLGIFYFIGKALRLMFESFH